MQEQADGQEVSGSESSRRRELTGPVVKMILGFLVGAGLMSGAELYPFLLPSGALVILLSTMFAHNQLLALFRHFPNPRLKAALHLINVLGPFALCVAVAGGYLWYLGTEYDYWGNYYLRPWRGYVLLGSALVGLLNLLQDPCNQAQQDFSPMRTTEVSGLLVDRSVFRKDEDG